VCWPVRQLDSFVRAEHWRTAFRYGGLSLESASLHVVAHSDQNGLALFEIGRLAVAALVALRHAVFRRRLRRVAMDDSHGDTDSGNHLFALASLRCRFRRRLVLFNLVTNTNRSDCHRSWRR